MYKFISRIGELIISAICAVGAFARLMWSVFLNVAFIFKRPSLVIEQLHFIGNHSLIIIAVSGLFVGFVLGLQGYHTLSMYGSEESLGLVVSLALTRELGPVVTALLFAGRAGTATTAEIGLMKSGEQLAAMDVMGINPIRRILVPRFLGWYHCYAYISYYIFCDWCCRWLGCRSRSYRCGFGIILVSDAVWN